MPIKSIEPSGGFASGSEGPLSPGKKLVFFAVPFLVFMLLVELFFRTLGYGALRDSQYMDGKPPNLYYWIIDSELGYRNRPNGRYIFTGVEGHPLSTTDEKGYRNGTGWDRRFEHPPEVALLGDSMIFGVELGDDQTIASQIYRQTGGLTPIVNSGVRGYSTVQEKRMLGRVLKDFPSVRVLLYVYVDNDLPGNLIAADDPVVPVPLLKYQGPNAAFAEVDPQIAPETEGKPFDPDRFVLPRPRLQATLRQLSIWSHSAAVNRLARSAQNLVAGTAEFVPAAGSTYTEQIGNLALQQLLREIKAISEQNEVLFLAVRAGDTNGPVDTANERNFLANCQAAGIQAIPSAARFAGNPHDYMTAFQNYSGYDFHYGPAGASRLAEVVAPAIREGLMMKRETAAVH